MIPTIKSSSSPLPFETRLLRGVSIAAIAVGLAACETTSDAFDAVAGVFGDDDTPPRSEAFPRAAQPEADPDFPALGATPPRPAADVNARRQALFETVEDEPALSPAPSDLVAAPAVDEAPQPSAVVVEGVVVAQAPAGGGLPSERAAAGLDFDTAGAPGAGSGFWPGVSAQAQTPDRAPEPQPAPDDFPTAAPIGDDAVLAAPAGATLPPPATPPERPTDVLEIVVDDAPTPPPVAHAQPIGRPAAATAPADDRHLWPGAAGRPHAQPAPTPAAETRSQGFWPGSPPQQPTLSPPIPQPPQPPIPQPPQPPIPQPNLGSPGSGALPDAQAAPQPEPPVVAQAYDRFYRPDDVGYGSVQPHVPTLSRRSAAPAALQSMPGFPATLREAGRVAPIANVGRTLPYGGRRIATLFFADGSARLSRDDIQALDDVAALYRAQGGVIRVDGHASRPTRARNPVEHKLINYEISGERADAVAAALIRRGVPKDRISALALSDNQPEFVDRGFGEAANRRVVIYLVGR